ncbi:S10 family peptidase [Alteromonas gilva]|uniref:Alpha/beta fold hydrolase n=1 Tax=Alteromonas gilva TaxID=2987522 RepID=A0ABT5L7V4_9ALTE|nr:alpha/beta fold hydrolase [Alteromonas gilva]MDC8831907.1 alpha/beta fold hydrolase [Alteromonas gilva]
MIKPIMLSVALLTGVLPCATVVAKQGNEAGFTTVKTTHQGTFGATAVTFNSVVEGFALEPLESGRLEVVSTSYLRQPESASRPVLFAFNGGPISPAVYLHTLALGPWRLAVDDNLSADPAQFPLIKNTYAPLDVADVVLFDPAGTGYSRFDSDTTPQMYFGNHNDAAQFVAFMQAWLTRHDRMDSPVYILGESYGTMRVAAVAEQLSEQKSKVNLRGIYLFGQALNLQETAQRHDNVLTYPLSLPTLAALGWYHQQLPDKNTTDFAAHMQAVNEFAYGDYLQVLLKGNTASNAEKTAIAERLEALTGLSAETHLQYDIRITKNQFRAELLKHKGLVLGANDGRYVQAPSEDAPLPDGSSTIYPAVFRAFDTIAAQKLGVDTPREYVVSSPVKGLGDWDWGSKAGPFAKYPYANGIADAMVQYPQLTVMVGAGHYDTLTTTGATDYLLRHADWPKERVMKRYYPGGHMAYTVEANLAQFSADLKALIAR